MEKFKLEVAEKESLATFFGLIYGGMKLLYVGYYYERCFALRNFKIYSLEARKELIQALIAEDKSILDRFVRESTTEAYLLDKDGQSCGHISSDLWMNWLAPERDELAEEFARWILWGYQSEQCAKIVSSCPESRTIMKCMEL